MTTLKDIHDRYRHPKRWWFRRLLVALLMTVGWTPFTLVAWLTGQLASLIGEGERLHLGFVDFVCPQWRGAFKWYHDGLDPGESAEREEEQ